MLISKMAIQTNNDNGRANSFSLFQSIKKKKLNLTSYPKYLKLLRLYELHHNCALHNEILARDYIKL